MNKTLITIGLLLTIIFFACDSDISDPPYLGFTSPQYKFGICNYIDFDSLVDFDNLLVKIESVHPFKASVIDTLSFDIAMFVLSDYGYIAYMSHDSTSNDFIVYDFINSNYDTLLSYKEDGSDTALRWLDVVYSIDYDFNKKLLFAVHNNKGFSELRKIVDRDSTELIRTFKNCQYAKFTNDYKQIQIVCRNNFPNSYYGNSLYIYKIEQDSLIHILDNDNVIGQTYRKSSSSPIYYLEMYPNGSSGKIHLKDGNYE